MTRFVEAGEEGAFAALVARHGPMVWSVCRRLLTQVHDDRLKKYLKDVVLDTYLRDNVKARRLRPDGTYERIPLAANEPQINSQLEFAKTIGTLLESSSSHAS